VAADVFPTQTAARTKAAAAVSFVCSSIRMNEPVWRLSAYASTASGSDPEADDGDVVQDQSRRGCLLGKRLNVDDGDELVGDRACRPRRVLERQLRALLERTLARPADTGFDLAAIASSSGIVVPSCGA